MKKDRKIGYARVSTREQNLDLQLDALKAAGCDEIFTDQGVSGAAIERDGLSQALGSVEEGDTLIVWKLDRLGRSLGFLADLIAEYGREGRGFVALQDGIDTTTTGGKLVFHIMAALAEFERDLISERTTAGMVAARRRGKHIGRPTSLSREQISHAKRQIASGEETIAGMASVLGVHRNTLRRAIAE
ncbi:recombinase family protein [Granulosicoccus sp. 3-233]|uniref:recombinase family protein n=1 Tax=Granulosicoccus sp. 3-233 TaxID=3417969 RepID=UPI003D32A000